MIMVREIVGIHIMIEIEKKKKKLNETHEYE